MAISRTSKIHQSVSEEQALPLVSYRLPKLDKSSKPKNSSLAQPRPSNLKRETMVTGIVTLFILILEFIIWWKLR